MSYLSEQPEEQFPLYPISTVSTLTGVNAVTLRAWERRYGLITPKRTAKGHRLYSPEDIERIKIILNLMDDGIAISRIPQLINQHVASLEEGRPQDEPWRGYQLAMLHALSRFDEAVLEDTYNEAMGLYPIDVVTRQLLLPLLRTLGERWQDATGNVAEEHFFSVFMRNKLGARFHHRNRQNTGPRLVAACLPFEQHEFGLLLLSLALHERGYRVILLGADMPIDELDYVVKRTRSDGVILSGSVDFGTTSLHNKIVKLVADVKVPVFIGGQVASKHLETITSTGAIALGDDLSIGIRQLMKYLPTSSDTLTNPQLQE